MHWRLDAICFVASLVPGAFGNTGVTGTAHVAAAGASINMCSEGTMQSPINLDKCVKTIDDADGNAEHWNMPMERPKLKMNYAANRAELKKVCEDDGCTLHIEPKSDVAVTNVLSVPGIGSYMLDHCVVRIPSEHTLNGNRYPLEVQCLHTMEYTDFKRKGMLSTLYEIGSEGKSSSFVSEFENDMPRDLASTNAVKGFYFSPTGTAGKSRYHTYKGSHTTGDCREDVDWFVMYDPTSITQGQLDKLKNNMTDHPYGWKPARPLQHLYGRQPEACYHTDHYEDAAAPAAMGVLSLALAISSIVARL